MGKNLERILATASLLTVLFVAPVESQRCEFNSMDDVGVDVKKISSDYFPGKVSGTGFTWEDFFSRLIAQVDSLDLESGDTSTVLTWNINEDLTAKASVLNEPGLFAPLKEAVGDDADLLADFTGRVSQGDDWEVSLDYNVQGENSNFGVRTAADLAVKRMGNAWDSAMNASADGMVNSFSSLSCEQRHSIATSLKEKAVYLMEDVKPRTLTANAFFHSRDDLVGPDEMGFKFKYTYGLSDKKSGVTRFNETRAQELLSSALLVEFSKFKDATTQVGSMIDSVPNEKMAAAVKMLKDVEEDVRVTADRRFAIEAEWKRTDDYEFSTGLANPLVLPEDESLTVTVGYSLQFKRDDRVAEELPRFEFSASYEDIDSDSARQSRLIAKLIASQQLSVLGDRTELTAGLVYSNKPEYIADQEFDEQISANLGLTFKVGRID